MKVAIMICGHMRTFKKAYGNFIKTLIDPNKKHDIDVYIATSSINTGRTNTRPTIDPVGDITHDQKYFKGKGLIYKIDKDSLVSEIKTTYNSKDFNLKEIFLQDEKLEDNNINPKSWKWFRQGIFSKPWLCFNSIPNINQYDVIVRTRPDLILYKKIKLFDSNDIKLFGGWRGDNKYETGKYIGDFFAFGNYNTMKTYCDIHLMEHPMKTTVKNHPFNSENQLALYLASKGIKTNFVITKRRDYRIRRFNDSNRQH
jgi:hypothetical protein